MKQNKKLKTLGLSAGILLFSISLLQAQEKADGLIVHLVDEAKEKGIAFEEIQRISFSEGEMVVKKNEDTKEVVFTFDSISKLTFGEFEIVDDQNGISTIPKIDLSVYITNTNEVVVRSEVGIEQLMLFGIEGKLLNKTTATRLYIGSLPSGVYLLQIKTEQGVVSKKIIKK